MNPQFPIKHSISIIYNVIFTNFCDQKQVYNVFTDICINGSFKSQLWNKSRAVIYLFI